MRVAKVVELTKAESEMLAKWARGRSTPARLVLRARIVLAAAEVLRNDAIAEKLRCTRRTVGMWRSRFVERRLAEIHSVPAG